VVGPAVDEAAQYYTTPYWIGISASPSVSMLLDRNKDDITNDHFFIQYSIFHKHSPRKMAGHYLGPQYDGNTNSNKCRNIFLEETTSQHIGITEYFTYKNTLDFYMYCLSH
jgi:hypothetical protein